MKKIKINFIIITLLFISKIHSQCPDGMTTSKDNLVKNGDFSQGNNFFASDYIFNNTSTCSGFMLPEGSYSVVPNPKFTHCNFSECNDHTYGTGSMMVVNGATIPNQTVWKQKINIKPNSVYYFSTWICNAITDAPSKLEFSINNKSLGEPIIAPMTSCNWKQFYSIWNSENNTTAEISIVNQNTIQYGNDFILDDIVFYLCEQPDFKNQLQVAKKGNIIELRSVFFDFGLSNIKKESNLQLNELIVFLKSKPSIEIEIRGHTDNVGNKNDNFILSEKRSKAVFEYLIKNGIPSNRLKYKGYGEDQPIDSNITLEGKQKNRRVEFKIINE